VDEAANTPFYMGPFDNVEQSASSSGVTKKFLTVAAMVDDTGLSIGDLVITMGYLTSTGGGSNNYEVVAVTGGSADGGSLIKSTGDTSLEFVGLFPGEDYSPRQWGAAADGVADDTAEIQAAIDYLKTFGDPFPKLHITHGSYLISAQLDRSGNGVYVDMFGDGIKNTRITVKTGSSGFNSMILLAVTGQNAARATTITGMTLDGNNIADYGIDARFMRYWTMENVECRKMVLAGTRAGNWSVRIFNNAFFDNPIGLLIHNAEFSANAQNNFLVNANEFTSNPIGIQIVDRGNDIEIFQNDFDVCTSVGVWAKKGGRNLDITNNYFEKCGGSTTVTVDLVSGTESMSAAIIIGLDTGSLSATWEGTINDNFFVDGDTTRHIVLYNVYNAVIENNRLHDATALATYFVELRELGCDRTRGRTLTVKGSYDIANITQLVGLNATNAALNHCNLVIDDQKSPELTNAIFNINDPTNSNLWTGATTINTTNYGGFAEYEFDVVADSNTSITRSFAIDFTTITLHPLLGRYVRVILTTKGTAAVDSGVRVRITVSGVTELDISRTNTVYDEEGSGSVVYIPIGATAFSILLSGVSSTLNSKMIGFSVCDAALPIGSLTSKVG